MSEKKAAALAAVRDERLTDHDLLGLAMYLTPLQRPDTALCVYARNGEGDAAMPGPVPLAEKLGLMVVTREPHPSREGHVRLSWCASEAGRVYVERFRSHWGDLGLWSTDADGKVGPMPWPGLPEPYQPGTIPVTTIPRMVPRPGRVADGEAIP